MSSFSGYNKGMELNFDKSTWSNAPCPPIDCKKKACKCGIKSVSLPAVLGDDSEGSNVAPKNGAYCNAIVRYEANGAVYIYSAEGVPTKVMGEVEKQEEDAITHLTISNLESSTWMPYGKENEYAEYAGFDVGTAVSLDAIFAKDDGGTLTVEELYNAVARGEKFTIDLPLRDIGEKVDPPLWGYRPDMGTVRNVPFSESQFETDVYTVLDSPVTKPATFFLSSAPVVLYENAGMVPYSLPFGVFSVDGHYLFIVTLMGDNAS